MIWSGGGQFYALVPASEKAAVEEFEREVNRWLLDRFDGDLFFVLGRADAQRSDEEFSALFRRAASDADRKKLRKGSSALGELDTPILGEASEPCAACGGQKEHGVDRCTKCRTQEELGQQLPRTAYLGLDYSVREDAQFVLDLPNGGMSWRLLETPREADGVYRLNATEIPEVEGSTAGGFVFTGSTVPYGGGVDRVWSFAEQAALGRGETELLHVSKMDIDSLGEAISTTMDKGLPGLAALSRSLELFFAGYINEIAGRLSYVRPLESNACEDCREELAHAETRTVEHTRGVGRTETEQIEYSRPDPSTRSALHDACVESVSPVYIGFAGGDDMLFVGPWDEAVTFGRTVRNEFSAYCSGTLTLSGGFVLSRPKYPIGRAVESAEERLEAAKEFSYQGRSKNAASLFGETLGWEMEEYPGTSDLLDIGHRFEELLGNEELSQAMLHTLLDLRDETYPDRVDPNEVSVGVQREWKLKYLLARNTEEPVISELEETVPRALPWITVPVSWASLATR
jgi:CRISPR-associated protein Csm1